MAKEERPGSRSRRILIRLLIPVAVLLVLELGLRARQWLKYGTLSPTFYDQELHVESGLWIPEPMSEVGPIRINSLGFRGPEIDVPKPPGRTRIAFLGGSTTFCAEATSLEATWPALVTAGLRERHPELDLDYVNAGGAGFSTRESLLNLRYRVAALEPDVIVIYHETNDLTQDTRLLAAEQGLFDPEVREQSWIGEVSLLWYLVEKNVRFLARKRGNRAEPLEYDADRLADGFAERLRELVTRSQEAAGTVVLVTFSRRLRPDQGEEEQLEASSSSRYYMPFMSLDGLFAGWEAYDRALRRVAEETGALLIEGADGIPGDASHFADSVHFTDAGCALQAQRVVEGLDPVLAAD